MNRSWRLGGCVWVAVAVMAAATPPIPISSSKTPPPLQASPATEGPPPPPATEGPPPPPATEGPPHIIIMVADDLGYNDVSWHNSQVLTPHLEALARGGIILEQSYVQPICTPTRSALLSSRYPFTIGRQHSVLRPSEPVGLDLKLKLLPQALKDSGYHTHAVGKWHLGFCSWDYTPTMRGFDTFFGYYNGAEDYFTHRRSGLFDTRMDSYYDLDTGACRGHNDTNGEDKKKQDGKHHDWLDLRYNTTPDTSKEGVYSTHMFASHVEDLLRTRSAEDPMFLYLAFQSVHAPLQVPDNYTRPYAHIHDHDRRTFLGMVSAMDEAVGRVVAALRATGHYHNSIIVFTTDNGGPTIHGANNWPLRGHKATLWEGGTRGAAFLHSPLLPNPGTVSHQLVHVTDWYRTLVGVAGGVSPPDLDGVDQWASLAGTAPPPRTHMVYNIDNTTHFLAGVRKGKFKLLVGYPGNGDWTPPPELEVYSTGVPQDTSVNSLFPASPSSLPRTSSIQPATQVELTGNLLGSRLPQFPVTSDALDLNGVRLENGRGAFSSLDAFTQMGLKSLPQKHQTLDFQRKKSSRKITQFKKKNWISTKRKYAGPLMVKMSFPEFHSGDKTVIDPNELRNFTTQRKDTLPVNKTAKISEADTTSISDVDPLSTEIVTANTNAANVTPTSSSDTNRNASVVKIDNSSSFETGIKLARYPLAPLSHEDENKYSQRTQCQEDTAITKASDLGTNIQQLLERITNKNDSQIRLYNVEVDPEERVNLASKLVGVVEELLQYLLEELPRYVEADIKPLVPEANPDNFNGVWSPGWC
nr:arylsulfatase B-like [Procambarus clarkii]XP_045604441.1 arylsulfatase B-like [Procambarus clarkii]